MLDEKAPLLVEVDPIILSRQSDAGGAVGDGRNLVPGTNATIDENSGSGKRTRGENDASMIHRVLSSAASIHPDPGGPESDLGSNEIKLRNEKYTAIVDGSGVLADPNGLDREPLKSDSRSWNEAKTESHAEYHSLGKGKMPYLGGDTRAE
ncbi:NAD-specific glutamate dehydrogenase [Fusarium albosuccineum]|uniref:NAD-specific glutamate dehydrogenase n=1 Tax=Fusarium albosuccineum TaxID=1237068 RepID=A0A8H4L6Y6_9HYPO|nr:NAD-specific glutamate dehydrogenase [Fusarium albosuccineum]